ncbi:D-aminoacyl-tRNA deacylase [Adhaeribacter pallidiroseus]|uniref:D-aminoacyl-tRNA deacylase n=1 Tax=Adhaeribacter pallidiroseus TaxID=2072847 RepID=A0A369QGZ0_9BACT|nr:D-aminoacyl-tRNA deacylase [Adhaeribacter pallidiroseus]RDC63540.1 D-aminoacyl-tRNA deacylase [Adhaeribacter pallidiroseus]
MRLVIQRVSQADVQIDNKIVGQIDVGLLLLAGITATDSEEDIHWISKKVVQMRIFSDEAGKMNKNVVDIKGSILLISQFTLMASTKKGNRPSFIEAAPPHLAIPLYEQLIKQLELDLGQKIQTGMFGADMQVSLTNDGPVTIILDSFSR